MSLDMIVIAAYFLITFLIGLWASKDVKTLEDFSTGGRGYGSFFVCAALSASFIGGGFTMGLAEKTFSFGLVYVLAMLGFSFKEFLMAKILVPKMQKFSSAVSVGDIMLKLYGHGARVFTGLSGFLICSGILAAQLSAFGYVLHVLLDWPHAWGMLLGVVVVLSYAILGGLKSVIAAEVFHFCVLIVAMPLILYFGWTHAGGTQALLENIPESHFSLFGSVGILGFSSLFLSFFFGETLAPPYVQRLLVGKSFYYTAKGALWSSVLSAPFFMIIGLIGLCALSFNKGLDSHLALSHVIATTLPIGFKGLAVAGVLAILMSSADSFLNAASISMTHDVVKALYPEISSQRELKISRYLTFLIGGGALFLATSLPGVIDLLLYSYKFWTPSILIPLVAGILGFRTSSRVFWASSLTGISVSILWMLYPMISEIDSSIVGIFANGIAFALFHPRNKSENHISSRGLEQRREAA